MLIVVGALLEAVVVLFAFRDVQTDRKDGVDLLNRPRQFVNRLPYDIKDDPHGADLAQHELDLTNLKTWQSERLRAGLARHTWSAWLSLAAVILTTVGGVLAVF